MSPGRGKADDTFRALQNVCAHERLVLGVSVKSISSSAAVTSLGDTRSNSGHDSTEFEEHLRGAWSLVTCVSCSYTWSSATSFVISMHHETPDTQEVTPEAVDSLDRQVRACVIRQPLLMLG